MRRQRVAIIAAVSQPAVVEVAPTFVVDSRLLHTAVVAYTVKAVSVIVVAVVVGIFVAEEPETDAEILTNSVVLQHAPRTIAQL